MKRRDFVRVLGGAVLTGAAVSSLAACGGDDTGNSDAPDAGVADCAANGARAGSISANHGHTLTISAGDILAGTPQSYSIQGAGDHPHTVMVTAANMTTLQGGGSVMITSSTDDAHSHSVMVVCA
jgi:hypothetical protein